MNIFNQQSFIQILLKASVYGHTNCGNVWSGWMANKYSKSMQWKPFRLIRITVLISFELYHDLLFIFQTTSTFIKRSIFSEEMKWYLFAAKKIALFHPNL